MSLNLAAPRMLWLLGSVVPLLILFFWRAWRKRQELITRFISARLLPNLVVGVSPARMKVRMSLIVAAVVFLILALARPQWGFIMEEARQRGLDIIVAIDVSNSMLAEDAPPNRLTRAKLAALDLLRRAKTDRLGLIAFAGTAFLQCPLTLDDAAFSQSVDSLDTRSISDPGTALAEAIDTAVKAFHDQGENHKVLVIFTDGEDHEGEAVTAAEKAFKEGMRIFTVGIGSPEGEQLRIRDERGRVDYLRDDQGNPVKSSLNEALLQEIARAAGGFYLPLRGTKTMDTLYEQGLAPLPKATNSSKLLRHYRERFHWPLGVAILLLLVEMFLPDRQPVRGAQAITAAPAAARAAVILALLLIPAASARAGTGRALREYEAGQYPEALKDYEKALEDKKDDPRLHFNAGTAAYQSRKLEEAAKQFNEVLSAPVPDLKLQERAYYNLGNTYYRLGEKLPPTAPPPAPSASASGIPDSRMKAWEQAVKHFESAQKLDDKDEDAKFNLSYVKRQLEELKKQEQQQQSKDNQDKKDDKDQKQDKDQQNQQSKDDQKKDQQKQDQSKQDQKSQEQKDRQNQQQAQKKKEDEKKSQAQAQKDKSDKKDQGASPGDEKAKEEAEREAAMMAASQMTPQQARQLLDAQKGDDEVLRLAPPAKEPSRGRSTKNW